MNVNNIIIFVSGLAIGAIGAGYFTKKKYEKIAQEEINSVKEAYKAKYEEVKQKEPKEDECSKIVEAETIVEEKPKFDSKVVKEYTKIINKNNYGSGKAKVNKNPGKMIIKPEELGEDSEYETVSLTYFVGDKILADDDGEKYDVEETIGVETLKMFGKYEDDVVCVRNIQEGIEYEVIKDPGTYAEYFGE